MQTIWKFLLRTVTTLAVVGLLALVCLTLWPQTRADILQPQPEQWWRLKPAPLGIEDQGPWPQTDASRQPLSQDDLPCYYIRDVRSGWVRYYQNRRWPDERRPLRLFLDMAERTTAEACAETSTGTSLACPPGHVLATVTDDHHPRCLPLDPQQK
jgi:hypothetical protein